MSLGRVGVGGQGSLVWVDREGREEILSAEPRGYGHPRISPDGTRVALDVRDDEDDILIWDFAREALRRLTFDPAIDGSPVWTPDGRQIVFSSQREGALNLFWRMADGTGTVERLMESSNGQRVGSFSPDGTRLAFSEWFPDTGVDLVLMSLEGERATEVLLRTELIERNPEISPDGNWLAYQSNVSGQSEIYLRPFPNATEGQQQVSTAGGRHPLWARNGEELFYLEPGTRPRLMAVPVKTGSTFDRGSPRPLFAWEYRFDGPSRRYDVSPDGQRFLVIKAGADEAAGDVHAPQIHVVLNWFEELKARVPVLSGTFTGPSASGGVTTYCGIYSGDISGILKVIISATGQVSGIYVENGGPFRAVRQAAPRGDDGLIAGQVTGTSLVLTDGPGSAATGTLQGNSLSGTWLDVSDPPETYSGTFSARMDNCP